MVFNPTPSSPKTSRWPLAGGLLAVLIILIIYLLNRNETISPLNVTPSPTPSIVPVLTETPSPINPAVDVPAATVLATGLSIPWDIAFLPDSSFLITERGGNLVHLYTDGIKKSIKLPHPVPKGEGGLLGITLHPTFVQNKYVYLYMTTAGSTGGTKNAVFRYVFENDALTNEKVIIKDIPGALYHDGGRLEFGPDGYLYITTGEAQTPPIAQDLSSLGGKILRLTDEGGIPSDNPFGTAVYSYGHRNPQGLTWDSAGRLWETEHGRSGVTSGMDELNSIEKGKNYGWPTIEGDKTSPGLVTPVLNSGAKTTWAPASALYHDGSIFFGGLKGEALYEAVLNGTQVTELKVHLLSQYGRIRTVKKGPDGIFYLTTSNKDGRGKPVGTDDRLIRINPALLK